MTNKGPGGIFSSQVYPLEIIRRRMQQVAAAAAVSSGQNVMTYAQQASMKAFSDAAKEIWVKEGFAGFYAGVVPNTIQARSICFQAPLLCCQ